MRFESDSEVLVMFVILDGEVTARNSSEWHKIYENCSKGSNRKIMTGIYLRENYVETCKLFVCILDKCTSVRLHETVQIKPVSNREYNTTFCVEYLIKQ